MSLRSIATVIAVGVACVLFPRNDADARGVGLHGGAGHFGGVRHFGFQRGHPTMHADTRRDMHDGRMHRGERDHWGERGWSDHFGRSNFGHWFRRSGFGGNARSPSIPDGQWHAGGALR